MNIYIYITRNLDCINAEKSKNEIESNVQK